MSGTHIVQIFADTVMICTKPCWICGQYSFLTVPREAWQKVEQNGEALDNAWPDGPAADKLLILTGVHPKCWDEEFPGDAQGETNA